MSSLIGGIANNGIGQVNGLLNTPGLLSELVGQSTRVQFLRQGLGVIFSADATVNESHSRQVAPTNFPLEDGTSISDNLMISPFELTLNGIVSDTPIYQQKERLLQTFGQAATTLVPPLGISVANAAYKAYTVSQKATSPSKEAYQTLTRLQAGDPVANPPIYPEPFICMTNYKRYYNCIISRLQFDRDASTSGACIFNLTLVQLRRVAPQTVQLSILSNPSLSAPRQDVGDAEQNAQLAAYQAGKAAGRSAIDNQVAAVKQVGKFLNIGQN